MKYGFFSRRQRVIFFFMLLSLSNLSYSLPGIVYAKGTTFVLDEKPFYYSGCNSYDLFTKSNTEIDTMMTNLHNDGIMVVRTWGFSHDTLYGFEPEKGVYNLAQFNRFDYVMKSAHDHGLKVIITLENYWEKYGGIDTRLSWEGISVMNNADKARFYTTDGCKTSYQKYVNFFITRKNTITGILYKDDPTIFAWELMNEPRYQDAGENSTGTTLRAWIDKMADYIKSKDPNHMVSAGIEGHQIEYGFGNDEGNPFVKIHQSPSIDFCTAHLYPDETWANLSPTQAAGIVDKWIDEAHSKVGKPFVLEAFNAHSNRERYWSAIYGEIEAKEAAGDNFWNFTDTARDDFDILQGNSILTTVFKPHADRMAAKNSSVGYPPKAFTQTTPENGATGLLPRCVFTWEASDGAKTYCIVVSANNDYSNPIINVPGITVTQYMPPEDLAFDTTYYWKVTGVNTLGNIDASNAGISFSTRSAPTVAPGSFSLSSPANAKAGVDVRPTFIWTPSNEALSYSLDVSTKPDYSSLVFNASDITGTSYTWSADLAFNTIYYWKVVAINNIGQTAASNAGYSFTTKPRETYPPPVVKITSPSQNSKFPNPAEITIKVTASTKNPDGINKIEFFDEKGQSIKGNNIPPGNKEYTAEHTFEDIQGGDYVFRVKAYDTQGVSSETNVSVSVTFESNLIGHWTFDGDSGSIAYDSSGHNNHAQVINGEYVSGIDGSALYFNGTTAALTKKSLLNGLHQFTIASWIKLEAADGQNGFWGQSGAIAFGIVANLSGEYLMQISTNDAGILEYGYRLSLRKWYHIAIMGDGKGLKLYLDGNSVRKTNDPVNEYNGSDGSFNIGGGGIWNPGGDFFVGAMDDVRLYNTAISDNELKRIASRQNNQPPTVRIIEPENKSTIEGPVDIDIKAEVSDADSGIGFVEFYVDEGPPYTDYAQQSEYKRQFEYMWRNVMPKIYYIKVVAHDTEGATGEAVSVITVTSKGTSLIGRWGFDEGHGVTAYDSSGNGNNGTIQNGRWVKGMKGNALEFSGNGFVQIGKGLLNNLKAFTCACWIKPEDEGYRTGFMGQGGSIEFGFGGPRSIDLWTPTTNAMDIEYPFGTAEWHHVAAVGTGQALLVYIDGEEKGRMDVPVSNYGISEMMFNIGGGGIFDTYGNFFSGAIDEVSVFNKALSPEEIAAMVKQYADKPSVSITAPENESTFSSPVDISVSVDAKSKNSALKKVELYVNKMFFREDTEPPYTFNLHFDTTGEFEVRAKAITSDGQWAEDAVSITIKTGKEETNGESTSEFKKKKDDEKPGNTELKRKSNDDPGIQENAFSAYTKHMHSSEYDVHLSTFPEKVKNESDNKYLLKNKTVKSEKSTEKAIGGFWQKTNDGRIVFVKSGPTSPPEEEKIALNVSNGKYNKNNGSGFSGNSGTYVFFIFFSGVILIVSAGVLLLFLRVKLRKNNMKAHS